MKALILNSGIGKRMGDLTKYKPKCMAEIGAGFTIISRQLCLLENAGIRETVITTGPFTDMLKSYVESLKPQMDIRFVANPEYESTNYIYSVYCAREYLRGDIISLHGDLVFEPSVLEDIAGSSESCMAVDSALPLPEKDFKARLEGNRVKAVGIEFFGEDCVACQPIYHMRGKDMQMWLGEISRFCSEGRRSVYAENALNNIMGQAALYTMELNGRLCSEIDNMEDLKMISARFVESERTRK
jgi:choline kinase